MIYECQKCNVALYVIASFFIDITRTNITKNDSPANSDTDPDLKFTFSLIFFYHYILDFGDYVLSISGYERFWLAPLFFLNIWNSVKKFWCFCYLHTSQTIYQEDKIILSCQNTW